MGELFPLPILHVCFANIYRRSASVWTVLSKVSSHVLASLLAPSSHVHNNQVKVNEAHPVSAVLKVKVKCVPCPLQ